YFNIPAYTYTDHKYRRNQYDLWSHEKDLHNQSVFFIGQCESCEEIKLAGSKRIQALEVDHIQIAQKLELALMEPMVDMGGELEKEFRIKLYNPYEYNIFPLKSNLPLEFRYIVLGGHEILYEGELEFLDFPEVVPSQTSLVKKVRIKIPVEIKTIEAIGFGFAYKGSRTSLLSPIYPIK
ncbi:MAG: hypothetical protein AAFR87_06560, partial [Bacteroidota bacterium]